ARAAPGCAGGSEPGSAWAAAPAAISINGKTMAAFLVTLACWTIMQKCTLNKAMHCKADVEAPELVSCAVRKLAIVADPHRDLARWPGGWKHAHRKVLVLGPPIAARDSCAWRAGKTFARHRHGRGRRRYRQRNQAGALRQ